MQLWHIIHISRKEICSIYLKRIIPNKIQHLLSCLIILISYSSLMMERSILQHKKLFNSHPFQPSNLHIHDSFSQQPSILSSYSIRLPCTAGLLANKLFPINSWAQSVLSWLGWNWTLLFFLKSEDDGFSLSPKAKMTLIGFLRCYCTSSWSLNSSFGRDLFSK